jgi:ribosomal silencing factor RsfS
MVVVHVLTEEARELYDLENLWGDAPKREAIEILKELGIIKQD